MRGTLLHPAWKLAGVAILWLGCTVLALAEPEAAEPPAQPAATKAADATRTEASITDRWYVVELLDPSLPSDRREELLHRLVLEAEGGSHNAAFLLGNLYFLGPTHPARLVERRLDQAERYFRMLLDEGDPRALTALAEVEMARGNASQAHVLVQAHMIFLEHIGRPVHEEGYAVGLLARSNEAERPPLERDTLVERVEAVMASHGMQMLAFDDREPPATPSMMAWAPVVEPVECRQTRSQTNSVTASRTFRSRAVSRWVGGLATLLVAVSPQGEVVDVLLLSSMPHATYAKDMSLTMKRSMVFNAVDETCPVRWVVVPVESGDSQTRVR